MDDITRQVNNLEEELICLRRDFHAHPELGLQEVRTSQIITRYLQDLSIPTVSSNKTGVVGLLKGAKPGPTLLLRADIDALPIEQDSDKPYCSTTKGVMHACGHDAHTAMLLVAAKVLAGRQADLSGNIKFVFEPNEENIGSLAMIEEGILEEPSVDGCIGMHIWSQLATGKVGIQAGPIMAGMYHFHLELKGKGGHTAAPHHCIDPVLPACAVVQGLQAIQTRECDALNEPLVIMVGIISGGTADNIIPETVTLRGTVRYMTKRKQEGVDLPLVQIKRVIDGICAAHNVTYSLKFTHGHPTLVNDQDMVSLITSVIEESDMDLEIEPFITLAGDDFSEFSARSPGVFYFLGAGKPGEINYPHHHPRFDIDESVLKDGVEIQVRAALRFLLEK